MKRLTLPQLLAWSADFLMQQGDLQAIFLIAIKDGKAEFCMLAPRKKTSVKVTPSRKSARGA